MLEVLHGPHVHGIMYSRRRIQSGISSLAHFPLFFIVIIIIIIILLSILLRLHNPASFGGLFHLRPLGSWNLNTFCQTAVRDTA
jgi:hypothetical protein